MTLKIMGNVFVLLGREKKAGLLGLSAEKAETILGVFSSQGGAVLAAEDISGCISGAGAKTSWTRSVPGERRSPIYMEAPDGTIYAIHETPLDHIKNDEGKDYAQS